MTNDTARKVRSAIRRWRWWLALPAAATGAAFLLLLWLRIPLAEISSALFQALTQADRLKEIITSYGRAAPLVFMLIQVLQVVLAPIPGEATGFIGGYLFGAAAGCFYSSVALTLGSWINFSIGRLIGRRGVRKIIPEKELQRFDDLLSHKGALVVFLLFLFPGFPKDYLCLFLGLSSMPMRLFILIAMIGRIPGTLMLSLQGALVFERKLLFWAAASLVYLVIILVVFYYRQTLYSWIERMNKSGTGYMDRGDEKRNP